MEENKILKLEEKYLDGKSKVIVGIRSEHITISKIYLKSFIKAKISHIEDLGDEMLVYTLLNFNNNEINNSYIVVKCYNDLEINIDDIVYLSFDYNHLHFFDYSTEENISLFHKQI